MAKQIMIVTGSPRREGNTNVVANWVAQGASEMGAEVEVVDVAHLKYAANGCTSCMQCQARREYGCVIDDEASKIISRMLYADVVVHATPVYFFGPSAQLKLVLDRTFSLYKFDLQTGEVHSPMKGKQFALIATAAGDELGGMEVVKATFEHICKVVGPELKMLSVPHTPFELHAIEQKEDVKLKAVAFGRELAQ